MHLGGQQGQEFIIIGEINKMIIKTLYRYIREDGGVTVSPEKPDCEYTELVRIIADDGKMLTRDGEVLCPVIDTDGVDGWYEVDVPTDSNEE